MAASVDQKLLRQTKFPPEFNQKVDIQKINVEVMKKWIAGKITEILKSEDDIVIELCFGLFERSRFPDIKSLQISLTGFLDKDAPKFCQELWNLCLSAQSSPRGVAKELLEAKKAELLQEKVDSERAIEEARQLKEGQASRERDIDAIRQREKAERGRGRGRGRNGRGDLEPPRSLRGGRSPRRPRSPGFRAPPARREADCYIPSGRGRSGANVHALPRAGGETDEGDGRCLRVEAAHHREQGGRDGPVHLLDRASRSSSSASSSSDDGRSKRADIVRSRPKRDARRLSRSPDDAEDKRRPLSRSGSRRPNKREKRRRSLQRYDPAARHRRNTSSISSPEQKRRKRRDSVEPSPPAADATTVGFVFCGPTASGKVRSLGAFRESLEDNANNVHHPPGTPSIQASSSLFSTVLDSSTLSLCNTFAHRSLPALHSFLSFLTPVKPHHVFWLKTSQSGGDEEDATQVFTPHFVCNSAPVVYTSAPVYSSASSTSTQTPGSGPPPGFNIEEAKKPLPKEDGKTASVSKTKTAAGGKEVSTKKEDKKKMTIGQRIKHELDHYWQGTKLLAAEVKISMKLALKMAAGYELSRREHRQLQRTVQDLGRLVPFSVFVIVPFAELLLPVALTIFPNMLPSTYESQHSREAKASRLSETRKSVSTFLRNTLRETSFPVSSKSAKKEEFQEFFRKVRATGESPTREDVIKVCKIFKDDLTLDNLSRPQLVGMCKYMNLNSFGTDAWLRYHIRHRMRQIKRDDKAISFEGVDSLSVPELQMACAARGIRTYGMSPARLREDLQLWLDLRLKYNIPSTLLVLSNAFMYTSGKDSEINSQIDALQAVLSAIPEELFHEMELEVHNAEGAATNKQRLEVLKEQQELIEEENKQKQAASSKNEPVAEEVKDDKDIDEKPVPKTDKAAVANAAAEAAGKADAEGKQEAQQQQQANKEEAVAAAPVKKD
ncbi:hypothetical protein DV735_g2172, partial [Chaetothyriales sp. CBS 134920]